VAKRAPKHVSPRCCRQGGGGSLRAGKPFINSVQATEKVFGNFTITARDKGGHSSVPRPDNAIYELSEGLVRFSHFAFPVEFNDVTRAYFERTAAVETPKRAPPCGRCSRIRAMPSRRRSSRETPVQLDTSHNVRGGDALGRTCAERASADRAGHHQLPHAPQHESRGSSI
jgi:acetylornithine deacetylase/succinyl-diaminopimelate desuccinylase-like protein